MATAKGYIHMPGQELAMADVDPAPACAAGSSKQPTVRHWEPQDPANDDDDASNDGLIVDETNFISMNVAASAEPQNEGKRQHAPAAFMFRPAFVELKEEGFAELPNTDGVGLHYHKVSMQWHASWPAGNKSPTWGKLRSEQKAILLALCALWRWFVQNCEWSTEEDNAYLEKLKAKLETVTF